MERGKCCLCHSLDWGGGSRQSRGYSNKIFPLNWTHYISIIEHVGGGAGRREGPDDLLSFLPITSISLLAFSSTSVISPHSQMGSVSSKSSTNYQKLQKYRQILSRFLFHHQVYLTHIPIVKINIQSVQNTWRTPPSQGPTSKFGFVKILTC